jgi:hypothetical protein
MITDAQLDAAAKAFDGDLDERRSGRERLRAALEAAEAIRRLESENPIPLTTKGPDGSPTGG